MKVNHRSIEVDDMSCSLGHTHFMVGDTYYLNEPCYVLFSAEWGNDEVIDELSDGADLTLFFFNRLPGVDVYFDWILTHPNYKDWFLTKDVKEGFEEGFKVRWDDDFESMIDVFRLLRMVNEFEETVKKFLGDRNDLKSYLLAIKRTVDYYGVGDGHTLTEHGADAFFRAVDSFIFSNKKEAA